MFMAKQIRIELGSKSETLENEISAELHGRKRSTWSGGHDVNKRRMKPKIEDETKERNET